MRIVGIETSGSTSSVALAQDGTVIRERIFASRQVICQVLAGEILDALDTETVQQADLDGIAVSIGPGSFTGLRVGVTMAKVLAYTCQVRLVGIATPEAWAAEVNVSPGGIVAVIQPARVRWVYLTIFRVLETGELQEELSPQIVSVAEVAAVLDETSQSHRLVLTGDAVGQLPPQVSQRLSLPGDDTDRLPDSPRARTIARIGAQRLPQADPEACFTLRPTYIAVSQAERSQGLDLGL